MAIRGKERRPGRRRGLLFLGLVSLGVVGSLVAIAASNPSASATASERSSDLEIKRSNAGRTDSGQPAYQGENPSNNLQLTFNPSGLHVAPRGARASEWSVDLAYSGMGSRGASAPPGVATLSASANRVDYDFGDLKQWYLNAEDAVELGFTILAAPHDAAAVGDAPLTLDLSVSGELRPRYDKPGYFVDLVSPDGESALRFGALRVTDAKGATLQTRLEARPGTPEGSAPGIRITIDAVDPAYPVVIGAALRSGVPSHPVPATVPGGGSGEMVGSPVTLGEGITESVSEIMARQESSRPAGPPRPRETHHEFEFELDLQEDPSAPAASHWPPWNPVTSTPKSTSTRIELPNLPQALGTSFKATDVNESGFIPPDSMGEIGPTQIVVHVNGRIKTFTKAGAPDGALNATDATFWNSVAPGVPPGTNAGISDPEVRYDRLSGRWFLLGITIAEAANNKIVLAVSSGPTIASQASFTFFSFPVGTPSPSDATSFCDYPSLGIDANALYTGCNMFTAAGAFRWTSAFVIRKSSIIGGGPMVVTGFANITGGCGVTTACTTAPCTVNAGPYAPRGVDNDDPQATEGYFIGSDLCFLSRVEIRRVSNPGGTPTLSSNIPLATITSTNMSAQQASGSTTNVDPSDSRLFMAAIHKNKLTGVSSLWTALSVETTTACVGSGTGGTRRIGARWHEIGNLTATPSVTQSGTLCTTATGANSLNSQRGFLYPSVVETGQGHVALAASFASASEFVGVASAGRLRTDPAAGTRSPESIVLNGAAAYTINDTGGRNRWGDYSITRVDPNDDQTVWTFQEYADTPANTWSVRVAQLLAPPPPVLASATPVCTGLASTTTTITGTDNCTAASCTNGLCTGGGTCPEFFDPGPDTGGPGFASHITASVTGGVGVNPFPATNIVLPGSPSTSRVLQATLSLNTTGASAGAQNITITNPDGQSTTGLGLLTVNPTPATPGATSNSPICAGAALQLNAPTVAGATYSWTGPNGFASSLQNPTIPGATAAATGVYSVAVTVSGCASSPGTTSATVIATGGSCTDNSLCTTGDTCQAGGSCSGAPVTCSPLDTCHDAGTCNSGTGLCSNPPKPDGATCSDGNACTQTDTCQSGSCSGSNPVVCSASDQCHDAGTCDTGSGICSDPPKADGSACTDANACTQSDSCQAGTCTGSNPVICSASDACHDAGVCDTGSGICSNPAKPDGASCEDGNPCTLPDTCQAGACQAGPPTDLDGDSHVNSSCGGDDCSDVNPFVWQPAADVTNLTVTNVSPADVAWDSQGISAGPETAYDLVSGSLGPGTGILFSAASCLQPAGPASYADGRPDPATGESFWYLARAANSCGVGTYGSASRDSDIPPCP